MLPRRIRKKNKPTIVAYEAYGEWQTFFDAKLPATWRIVRLNYYYTDAYWRAANLGLTGPVGPTGAVGPTGITASIIPF